MTEHIEPVEARVEADPKRPWKAVAAFVVTVLGTLWAALEGREDLGDLTVMGWASIIIPTILATAAVYGVRNPVVAR